MFTEKELANVESDGRVVQNARDPPGQKSVYIPPGNTWREVYRLSTFKDFPSDTVMDLRELAANGFYFTGYKDRVKCFSCGINTENWVQGDDPSSSRWHSEDCSFFYGTNSDNEPIHARFSRLGFMTPLRNQALNQKQKIYDKPSTGGRPAINGSSHNCTKPLVSSSFNNGQEAKVSSSHSQSPTSSGNSENELLFSCRHPINPHMKSIEARFQTFIDNFNRWPGHRIRATPKDIAQAGMFYLGEGDRVKCWYCNGGLQNWDQEDVPWEEHAKWFPLCEFVLQKKGLQFVQDIVDRFPNLSRPQLHNPANVPSLRIRVLQQRNFEFANVFSHQSRSEQQPIIIDPKLDLEKRKKKIDEEMKSSKFVSEAKLMGIDDETIRAVLKRQYEHYDDTFSTFSAFVEAFLDYDNSNQAVETEQLPKSQIPPSKGASRLRELEDTRNCKICHKNQANIVFIPCGHLAVCDQCSGQVSNCPLCHSFIRNKVRSYIS